MLNSFFCPSFFPQFFALPSTILSSFHPSFFSPSSFSAFLFDLSTLIYSSYTSLPPSLIPYHLSSLLYSSILTAFLSSTLYRLFPSALLSLNLSSITAFHCIFFTLPSSKLSFTLLHISLSLASPCHHTAFHPVTLSPFCSTHLSTTLPPLPFTLRTLYPSTTLFFPPISPPFTPHSLSPFHPSFLPPFCNSFF